MFRTTLIAAFLAPSLVLAAGSDNSTPPKSTKTTTECEAGQVYDTRSRTCLTARDSRLDDDQRYQAVRELAYAGRYGDSLKVLATMSDQNDDRVLTYYGFNHRRAGRIALGMEFYRKALEKNPDNLLARSYYGQAFVAQGDMTSAQAQLTQIQARDGRDTWAETALKRAIQSGVGYDY